MSVSVTKKEANQSGRVYEKLIGESQLNFLRSYGFNQFQDVIDGSFKSFHFTTSDRLRPKIAENRTTFTL